MRLFPIVLGITLTEYPTISGAQFKYPISIDKVPTIYFIDRCAGLMLAMNRIEGTDLEVKNSMMGTYYMYSNLSQYVYTIERGLSSENSSRIS